MIISIPSCIAHARYADILNRPMEAIIKYGYSRYPVLTGMSSIGVL
jgi:hypothetical protein